MKPALLPSPGSTTVGSPWWHNYTVRQWTRLVQPMRNTLLELGFNLPDPPAGQANPPPSILPTIAA